MNLLEVQMAECPHKTSYKKNLIYFQFEFNWHAVEIEQLTILISDAESDTIYMRICQTFTKRLLRRSTIADFLVRFASYIELGSSSETQGLLAGRCDIFGRKFRAGEPLGTYSYRISSRSGRIPSHRKIFFWSISEEF